MGEPHGSEYHQRIDTPDGRRFCKVIFTPNGRIKPDWVEVDDRQERHPEGVTELPPKKILERKLHESIALSRALLESRTGRRDREKIMPKHETKANR